MATPIQLCRNTLTVERSSLWKSVQQWMSPACQVCYLGLQDPVLALFLLFAGGIYNSSDAKLYCMVLKNAHMSSNLIENSTDEEKRYSYQESHITVAID